MGAKKYKYFVGGLVYETDIRFPEFITTDAPSTTIIEYGNVPETLENGQQVRALIQINNKDELLFEMPNLARFLVEGSKKVTIQLLDELRKNDAEKYLLTFVLGMLSYKIGMYPLHGGGIVHNNEAYLFTGHSGAGKSTTIAALKTEGFNVLGDDIANLFIKDGEVYVHPCFPRFKLWEESLDLLNLKNTGEYKLKSNIDKFLVPVDDKFETSAIKVKRIYHLCSNSEEEINFTPITGQQKLIEFRDNTYKPWAPNLLGLQKDHFIMMGKMLPKIEWYQFNRTKEKEYFKEMTKSLVEHIKNG